MDNRQDIIDAITRVKDSNRNTVASVATQIVTDGANTMASPDQRLGLGLGPQDGLGPNNNNQPDTDSIESITPMDDDEIVSTVMSFVGDTNISDGSTGSDIETALSYYYGQLPTLSGASAKDINASRYVSLDIQDTIEATVAVISIMFATGNLVVFTPEGQADEDQAQMETDLLNYIFFEEMDGYILLQGALRDALLNRNCTAEVYYDDKTEVSFDTYENVMPTALPQILQPQSEGEQVEVVEQIFKKETEIDVVNSQVLDVNQDQTISIRVKRTKQGGGPVVEIVKPENVLVSASHSTPILSDAEFCGRIDIVTQSNLIARGYDPEIINDLPEYAAQNDLYGRQHTADNFDYFTPASNKNIEVYTVYANLDVDGDGIAERRKIVVSNNTLLSNETVNSVGLVGGVTTMALHNYAGISVFDKLVAIQVAKTDIYRSIIDGTKLSTNPRIGVVGGGVNIDDLLQSRTGGVVRMERPNSIVDIPNAQVPQSSYTFLNLMDQTRSERGGSAIGTANEAMKVSGDTAHGIERVMSSMEQSNALLARTFAETFIRGIFTELHNVVRAAAMGPIQAKIGGTWINSDPRSWMKRTKMSVTIGGSQAERGRRANAIENVIAKQEKLAQAGSTLFDETKLYNALTTQAKYSDINNPDTYYVDPKSEEGQQAKQAKDMKKEEAKAKQDEAEQQMIQAQAMLSKAEVMKGQAQIQSAQARLDIGTIKGENDRLQTLLDTAGDDKDLAYKYHELQTNTAIQLAEAELKYPQTPANENVEENFETISNL